MGHRGFCRVRPAHVAGLVKRYRQLLGEMRYAERLEPLNAERTANLSQALISLAESIRIIDSTTDLLLLKPIRYQPLQPLPGTALMRAALTILRTSSTPLNIACLVKAIEVDNNIQFACSGDAQHFKTRGIVCHQNGEYCIKRKT